MSFNPSGIEGSADFKAPWKNQWTSKLPSVDILAFSIVSLSVLLITGLYCFQFRGLPFSENADKWGVFGDYIGGLLNPIVSFATLLVAIAVLRLQRHELQLARGQLEHAARLMEQQFESMEGSRLNAMFDSCREDINASFTAISASASQGQSSPLFVIEALSRKLELTDPLIALNSHAVSFSLKASGYEIPLAIEPWDWSISWGNDAREHLRMMLPMCRALGETLKTISSMPEPYKIRNFSRLRSTLGEWPLSTFTYFLVMHPDGRAYQTCAAQGHVLVNMNLQRARAFAITYLPPETYLLH